MGVEVEVEVGRGGNGEAGLALIHCNQGSKQPVIHWPWKAMEDGRLRNLRQAEAARVCFSEAGPVG